MENKLLVVYFTWSGTSKIIAERIKNELNADIFQIEAVKKYPNKYITCVAQAGMEKLKKERPQLKRELENISEYKKIVLVFPNWWGTLPMPVFSFLEKYDFKEKIILPICMHGGGGLTNTVKDLKKVCTDANILDGTAIKKQDVDSEETKKILEKLVNELK
ncbi:flavodoxin [Fusobacterium varium]|uniref:flavodoxin n=1 Tax=Fusobacterium TaxID=848 RepID=UPI000E9E101B|nr:MULTISPECIES: flavodoxin [Fusobacterium]UYI79369.1 MAG: flavodoxin [Fusobacterium varium]HBJ79421.1 flavodoxin [Fusobacterium sp.]